MCQCIASCSSATEPREIYYLVKSRHRLIRTTNLHLEERGLIAIAAAPWTLYAALLCIVPGAWSSKHVFFLLVGEILARVDGPINGVLIGAGSALQSVVAGVHPGEDEEVGTIGTDCDFKMIGVVSMYVDNTAFVV